MIPTTLGLWLLLQTVTAQPAGISGVIRDIAGGTVAGATVIARPAAASDVQTVSGPDGRFALTLSQPLTGAVTLIVRAPGFAESRQSISPGPARMNLEIVLAPASISEMVTVTATRSEQRLGDVPASVHVLGREDIRRSPALVADDLLRQVPTFSLFRRTSSLASHPTAQGVSLRGVGPSGVSRTLVLLDGVPFNDPFGGWVYWSRVPLESAERIEVVQGSTSSLYGNYAMGGVINIVTRPAAPRTLEVKSLIGSRKSPKIDVTASDVWGRFSIAVDGSAFRTDGYPIVAAAERGRVDNNAAVAFRNLNARLNYATNDRVRAFFRVGHFHEARDNGKASTIDGTEEANDTTWTSVSGGVRVNLPDRSQLLASVFGDVERFHSNFLAVPAVTPPRSIGRMTLKQTVPTHAVGGMAQWSRTLGARQLVTTGVDWRWIDGDSEEDGLDAVTGTQVTLRRISGGTQQTLGAYVQDLITATPKLVVTLAARVDRWRNYDAHNLETNVPSGTPTLGHNPALPERQDTVVSPRAGVLYHLSQRVTVWANAGSGFRAPTLNELYRQFRVGTTLTLANNQLGPERLVGGDIGISVVPAAGLIWRATWFDNRVKDPVSNVTLNVTPGLTTQQRQNLGRTRIWGIETDADYRLGPYWTFSGGYMYGHATVKAFAAVPSLIGKFLPQVPRHRGSIQVVFAHPRFVTVVVGVQAVGRQFDDDQNARVVPGYAEPGLPKYALVELNVSRAFGRRLEVFVSAQNLLDQTYYVGTLPTTVGSPALVSGGVRLRFAGR